MHFDTVESDEVQIQASNTTRSGYFSRIDAELLHARDQSGAFEAHACRGAGWTSDTAIALFQNAHDRVALIGFSRSGDGSRSAVAAQFTDWYLQCGTVSQNHRPLN